MLRQDGRGVLQELRIDSFNAEHAVAPPEHLGIGLGGHGIHHERHRQIEHHRSIEHLPHHRLVDVEANGVLPAKNGRAAHLAACEVGLKHAEVFGHIVVEHQHAVAGAEAHLAREFVGVDARFGIADIGAAPDTADCAVGDNREDEIEQHSPGEHKQALPCGLGAELPRLGLALELVHVDRFVDHARDLAVAAEGQPADAELGLTPAPAGDGLAADVEKKVELLHPDAEKAGEEEVSEFVDYDKDGQSKDNLQSLEEYDHN